MLQNDLFVAIFDESIHISELFYISTNTNTKS